MPLLSFCVMALHAGSNNATTYNERMHSPVGCIYSNLRCSLKPSELEHLTLALFYVRRWIEEQWREVRKPLRWMISKESG